MLTLVLGAACFGSGRLPRLPEWLKRLIEAAAVTLAAALIQWAVELAKEQVKTVKERRAAARQTPPPGPLRDTDTGEDPEVGDTCHP